MVKNAIIQLTNNERRVFWTLVVSISAFLMLYAYFINATILNIIERKEMSKSALVLSAEISDLESRYVALGSAVDLNAAHAMGFTDVFEPLFVSRGGDSRTLSLLDGQIDGI